MSETVLHPRRTFTTMKRPSVRGLLGLVVFGALLAATASQPANGAVVRQPYLQQGTPTSMTIVWLTDTSSNSIVHYGTTAGSLTQSVSNASSVTNHVITITGLSPATRYYYDVGSTSAVQAGGTNQHYFVTSPTAGSTGSFRTWIVGDSGNASSAQLAVRNAMTTFTGAQPPDIYLHMGDIAYTAGTDEEFTTNHFNIYQDILRHTVFWPTLGNHEGQSTTSGQPGSSTGPYYNAFVLPTAAEAGGVASGTEAYYSFDYANVHFISLNSYQVSRSPSGPMATWLASDLASTNQQWVVAYWHHPPYTHGTHNSDSESELIQMRENILPILEAGGVDLVLGGHSHVYERSYLIDGVYSTPTPNLATLQAQGHIIDDGNGKVSGDGAYLKSPGQNSHEGAVYVVAGHGGAGTGGSLNHPVMYFSELSNGSCLLDISGNMLTLTNLRSNGQVSDNFSIVKGNLPPKIASVTPVKSAVLNDVTSIEVTFSTAVTGVNAADLTVNGSPATSMTPSGGGTIYTFSGFAAPGNGTVHVSVAPGGIADATDGGLLFAGDSWLYTIDTSPPTVADETPERDREYGVIPSIIVNFSKPVTGVVASSLTVNGSPATSLSGISGSSGPYTFSGFAAPPIGLVSVTLSAGVIQDEQARPFAGDTWNYALSAHLVINEFLASNNTSSTDEFGEHDDYLEIYNPSQSAVDMSGMYLTDSLGFPAQYEIPQGVVIPAGGHLVFWCDGQPGQGPLHTNFNLLRAPGEQIGLFDKEANEFAEIDSLTYTTQTTDVPVGRFPDGATGFVAMPSTPGATNTISCSNSSECSALADACNTGVCSSNRCVSQAVNQGGSCDDGIACRTPDTCSAGVCNGGSSTCGAGEVCNFVTGLCVVPAVDPLPIPVGSSWSYFKGTVAPPASWNTIAFDDSTWLNGASGFGYGPDCTAQRGTTLSDMSNGYWSIYLRHRFSVDNPALVLSMNLTVDYDDSWVAYLNGAEVARSVSMGGTAGTPTAHNAPAAASHECSSCDGPPCNAADTVSISLSGLVAGTNVIAIHGHNQSLAGSDFTLTPSLTSTESESCFTDVECNDNNPCTDDLCNFNTGTCSNDVDDSNICSDGVACTIDTCSGGVCGSAESCPVGRTCNHSSGSCETAPVTVTFQDGVGGYVGELDTYVHAGAPTANNSAANPLVVDGPTVAVPADERQTLIRFDAMFASQGGPIPDGASISSATLQLNITNPSLDGAELHRMLVAWTPTSTWNSLTNGVQRDDVESVAAADVSSLFNGTTPALHTINVTSSVAAWSAGGVKQGWVLVTPAGGSDSWQFDSAEVATVANRPKLSVTYTFTPPCTVDGDCDDINVCNGVESCVSGTCTNGTALNCDDSNVCTTDSCNAATGCGHSNNGVGCSDGNACTTGDACSGGSCQPGGASNCDDSNVCTNDSCDTGLGCLHANNTASCSDGNLCTTSDVCSGGSCSGTPVSCPVGQTCNPGTGTCAASAVTTSFQDGFLGYLSTQDTYLSQAAPTTVEGALTNWRWDTENPAPNAEFGLVRFDNIIGGGAGQIPSGATIQSATLTLEVTDASVAPAGTINESTVDWAEATATWNNFGADAGVQSDEYLASPSYVAPIDLGTAGIAVTQSVQAWVSGTRSNFGWVVRPNSTNGAQVNSAEFATPASRPKLTVTYVSTPTCTVDGDCNDANPCTDDTCSAGTCNYANNTASCSDGIACTTDACAGGVCVGTNACTGGQTCNTGTGLCESVPVTVTFQQNVSGYTGAVDTYIDAGFTTTSNATNVLLTTDGVPPATDERQTLVRFGNIFGSGAGQIPAGSTISSATLTVNVSNQATTAAVNFHRMKSTWSDTNTWSTFGATPWNATPGIQADDVEAVSTADASPTNIPLGLQGITVTSSLQAWAASPASNHGWVLQTAPADSLVFDSSEATTAANRPKLSVTYTAPAASCTVDGDCNDSNACNGVETCVSNVCQPGTALNCDDSNVCTTDSCVPATGCAHANNTASCSDGNACTTGDVCGGGSCQPGGATNCDDANVCTNDSCVAPTGCVHANNTAACSDGNLCTTGDVCGGGSCSGTAVSCPVGQSCVPATGLCTSGSVTVSFQQGQNGYGGTADTFIDAALGSQATVTPIVADSSPEEHILLRFDGIFGTGPNQIPAGSTISSATLTLRVGSGTNDQSANPVNYHRLLHAWSDTGVWADYGVPPWNASGGIQSDGTDALAAIEATATMSSASTSYPVSVLASLQAWSTSPSNNHGWAILPTGTDGVRIESSESTTPANRPLLSVTYAPPAPSCTVDGDCSDGNVCTTDMCVSGTCSHTNNTVSCSDGSACTTGDACSGGVCVGGPAPNCDDGNICTTDGCNPGTGCTHTNNTNPCSDGNACTTGDVCGGGACGGSPVICPSGQSCNPGTGLCETQGRMSCSLASPFVTSGGTVGMTVFLENLGNLVGIRGYQTQIAITRTSGSGTLDVDCPGGVSINEARPDYIFTGQSNTFPVVNCPLKRASSSLLSGSVVVGASPAYLSSYILTASSAPGSTFEIAISPSPDSALGNASGQPVAFAVSAPCTVTVTGGCSVDADCDDTNPCTDDTCVATSCQYANNTNACSDGSACTTNDACSGGTCVGGPAPNCDDGNDCTTDGCNPGTGCTNSNNTNPCDDGNSCTTDACSGGACVGTPLDCNDGSICTTDACVDGACTHTTSGLCSISGTVRYYRNNASGGSEPSTKPVPNVDIDATQDLLAESTTGAAGTYDLGSRSGSLVVQTLDKFGNPRASDHNDAVTSFDATIIAQFAVNSITLSNNQRIAGDVTGNGTVTSFDASKVAQFAVQIIDHFDVAVSEGSDWRFLRCDTYTDATNQNCGTPTYSHSPLTASATDDFYAVLYGDVTGNWQPGAAFASSIDSPTSDEEREAADRDRQEAAGVASDRFEALRSRDASAGPAELSVAGWSAPLRRGQRRDVTVTLNRADGVEALDLALDYDPRLVSIVAVRATDIGSALTLATRDLGGSVKVAAYGTRPLQGSGSVFIVTVEARTDLGRKVPVRVRGEANEGGIPLVVAGHGDVAVVPAPKGTQPSRGGR